MALGPVLLGYAEPVVDEAIRAPARAGDHVHAHAPARGRGRRAHRRACARGRGGALRQVRLRRHVGAPSEPPARITGRDHVLVCRLPRLARLVHRHDDARPAACPAAVAALTSTFPFDDLDALERALDEHAGDVAAVVVEPSGAEFPAPGYLDGVGRPALAQHGALVDLRRGHHRLPPRPRRCPRAVRRAPRLLLLRQGARERHADLRRRRAVGGDEGVRGHLLLGHPRRRGAALAAARAVLDTVADGTVLAQIADKRCPTSSGHCRRSLERSGAARSDPDRWRAAALRRVAACEIRPRHEELRAADASPSTASCSTARCSSAPVTPTTTSSARSQPSAGACDAIVVPADLRPLLVRRTRSRRCSGPRDPGCRAHPRSGRRFDRCATRSQPDRGRRQGRRDGRVFDRAETLEPARGSTARPRRRSTATTASSSPHRPRSTPSMAAAALAAGARVLVEKPLAVEPHEAAELSRSGAIDSASPTTFGFINRCSKR